MSMPKNLVFIRHGESQANKLLETINKSEYLREENVTHPDRTWELTPKGIQQAQRIGKIFVKGNSDAHMWFDHYYVSPFIRTKQTAAYLNIENAKWETLREIRERSWGEIDSIHQTQFKTNYPRNYDLHLKDPLYWQPPGGESLAEVSEGRLGSFFAKLHRDNAGENVLCVTHHDVMTCVRIVLEHLSDEEITLKLKDGELSFPNASALIYTRVDPFTGELHKKLSYFRLIWIDDDNELHQDGWFKISKNKYDNEQLLESI